MSERWLFTLVLWAVHASAFFVTWGVYGILHRFGVAPRFRVVGGKPPGEELLRRATPDVLIGQLLFAPVLAFVVFPAWTAMGGAFGADPPTVQVLAWQLVACIVIQDTTFYWSHRTLHTKWLFQKIHRKHHDFRYVRGVSAEYAHPVEMILNVSSTMLGPILLAVHPWTIALWLGIRTWETMEAHSGYAFTALASRHAYHHLYASRGCLGSFFGMWDRLMGTDTHWRSWQKSQTHR